ncbi:MAG: phosphoribosylglycinamide formyltransferase [Lachnospiraceae bacterium]|nr:phosphoribosylglycinamide formyltransferase [Lachnospiraceae bacterium]
MLRIAVCVSGGGTNLGAIFKAIDNGIIKNGEIVKVISNNANAYALTRAKERNVEAVCISPKSYPDRETFNEALLSGLKEADPDLIVLAGFLVNVPAIVVSAFKNRIINIHPSLIPSFCGKGYYGLKVHEAVLARGVKVTGATVHFVDEGIDTGKILAQKAVYVEDGDTPEILQRRVMEQAEWIILPDVISRICAGEISIG